MEVALPAPVEQSKPQGLPRLARPYLVGVLAAGAAIALPTLRDLDRPGNPWLLFAVLVFAASAAQLFVVPDPAGGSLPVFDAAGWRSAARADSGWDAPSWSSANWSDAGWSDASWSAANWSDSSGADASWSDVSGSDANWADDAADDYLSAGGYWISDAELAAALAEYGTP